MSITIIASSGAAMLRRIVGPPAPPLLNSSVALSHSARPVCIVEPDRPCSSSHLLTRMCTTKSFDVCTASSTDVSTENDGCSSSKRSDESLLSVKIPKRRCDVHLVSKSTHQLTAAQLTHFTHLQKLLQRLPGLPQQPCDPKEVKSETAEASHPLSRGGEDASRSFETSTPAESGYACCSELVVVSRVISSAVLNSTSEEVTNVSARDEVFTGVNYAFHKRINSDGATLRGILKGCAEQNALGAAAASGCIYADITDVFLLAFRLSPRTSLRAPELHKANTTLASPTSTPCAADCLSSAPVAAQAAAVFPCPECWRHLCHVAHARSQQKRPPLRLFVHSASPVVTLHLFAVAQKRMKTIDAPIDVCIVSA